MPLPALAARSNETQENIMTGQNLDQLRQQLAKAESERDAWRGKPGHHYKMACAMVAALRKQIAATESSQP